MIRVLITDPLSDKAIEELNEIPEFEVIEKIGLSPAKLKQEIKNHEAILVRSSTRLTPQILEQADNLRLIVRVGIGMENIDHDFAKKKNIEVINTLLATATTVAEFTLASILGVCRMIGPAYQSMKSHRWEKEKFAKGIELAGKTAGVIGFDPIGQEVARRLTALGMTVIYYDPRSNQPDSQVRQVTLEELLKTADVVTIHLPLTEKTKDLLTESELSLMKESSVLVNVSRKGIINETALLKALNAGRITAVAMDIDEKEVGGDYTLIDHERMFPTPHLVASTEEGQERAGLEAVLVLKEFFNV